MDLPELIGSEKQITWANDLRAKVIEKYEAYIAEKEKFFLYNKEGNKIWTCKSELSDALNCAI